MSNRNPRPGAAAEASRPDLDWQERAACVDRDPELFFAPDINLEEADLAELAEAAAEWKRREVKAKAICSGCIVQVPCLKFAVREPMRSGIWGGVGESDRARMRRNYLRQLRSAA